MATNQVNGKQYVGVASKTVELRKRQHKTSKHPLGRAIRKYGEDNFTWRVIDIALTWERLLSLEQGYIAFYDCRTPKGYNITAGGRGLHGYKFSKESCAKMSAATILQMRSKKVRAALSKSSKEMWDRPGFRERHGASLARTTAKSEYRAAVSDRKTKEWADPKIRRNHERGIRAAFKRPEVIAKFKETQKANGACPKLRAKRRAHMTAAWAHPEKRANLLRGIRSQKAGNPKRIAATKAAWADPMGRKRLLDGMKAIDKATAAKLGWERRRTLASQ